MESRQLGGTGLVVSRMGLGLAALGRPAYINLGHGDDLAGQRSVDALQRRTAQVLDRAWQAGITYVDAARSYGRAEQFLAAWLRPRGDHERPVVGSKWGYEYVGGWQLDADAHEVKEHSRAMFVRQVGETAAAFGRMPELYQVHSLTLDSGALDDGPLLDAIGALRAEGTYAGISLSGPRQGETAEQALAVERDGVRLFSTVQATWNVLEPSAGPALRAAHDAGVGIIVKEAVANGRLTPQTDDDAVCRTLRPIADRVGVGVDAVALAAVLAQPWADVVLSGVATAGHLDENVRALDVELDSDDLAAAEGLAEPAYAYWERRGALQWT